MGKRKKRRKEGEKGRGEKRGKGRGGKRRSGERRTKCQTILLAGKDSVGLQYFMCG